MKLVLLENVYNLGEIGDEVDVRNGYARNYLIPQHKAMRATEEARQKAEALRSEYAQQRTQIIDDYKTRAETAVKEIAFERLCTDTGHLYGSVTAADIAEAMSAQGSAIDKSEVDQSAHIKEIGEYDVSVNLHPEVSFSVKVIVTKEADEATAETAAPEGAETANAEPEAVPATETEA